MPVRSSEILCREGRFMLWCCRWVSAKCHVKCSNFSWAHLAFAQVGSHEHCLTADLNNNLIMPGLVWCQCTGFSCFSQTTASLCTEDTNFCPLERIKCPFVQLSLPSFLQLSKVCHCQGLSLKHGPMEQGLLLLFHVCSSKCQSTPSMLHAGRSLCGWSHRNDSRKPPWAWKRATEKFERSWWQPFL